MNPILLLGLPIFGIVTNPYPIQFRESPFQYGDCFFCVFSVMHKIAFSRLKFRQSHCHGAPLLAKNLGNQHTAPANHELSKQEKGRESLAAARRRWQHQRQWQRRKEWRWCTKDSGRAIAAAWMLRRVKRGDGAQCDGGSVVAAAWRLWR
jgi:hypothetical protein